MSHPCTSHPILGQALAYWRRIGGERTMPARRDFDPAAVPALLPHLQLIDIVDGRFRYRLVGTALVDAFGRDYTGQYPDELFEGPRAQMISDVFERVRQARRPMFLRSRYVTARNIDLIADRLYLPLSGDGRDVDMILGALAFASPAPEPVAGAWGSARLTSAGAQLEVVDFE